MKLSILSVTAAFLSTSTAYVPQGSSRPSFKSTSESSSVGTFQPSFPTATNKAALPAAVATLTVMAAPFAAIAEEVADDYEYGAVDAPIGLAWGAGLLAVLTALLPIALQGGEEAFEEMKAKDADSWGSGNSNRLNSRK